MSASILDDQPRTLTARDCRDQFAAYWLRLALATDDTTRRGVYARFDQWLDLLNDVNRGR